MQLNNPQSPLNCLQALVASKTHRRINSSAVRALCGDISDMTLHRWLKNPALAFPKPTYIGPRRFWRETEILEWLDRQGVAA